MPAELYDHDMERATLAALSTASQLDPPSALVCLERASLEPGDFHDPVHARLFSALSEVLRERRPADALGLKASAAGEVPWDRICAVAMDGSIGEASTIKAYADSIRDLSERRYLLKTMAEQIAAIRDRRITPAESTNVLSSLSARVRNRKSEVRTVAQLLSNAADHIQRVSDGVEVPVLPTHLPKLDEVIGGLQPTLTLVGALPGVGKSALLATIAQLQAQSGVRGGVISLEDEPTWLTYRMLSHESGVDQFVMKFKRLTDTQHAKVGEGYAKLNAYGGNILTVDGSEEGLSLEAVIQSCHDMVLNHGAKYIIVDHLGEISGGQNGDRYDLEVSRQLSRLRGISNRYGIPVVVAMHLRRREGLGAGNTPRLSDFANSSGAERKARVALCLSREPDSDTLQVHILKNTNGTAGKTVSLKFAGAAAMIRDMERRQS